MRALSLILIIGGICWGSLLGIAAERPSMPNSRMLYHEMALEGTIDYTVFERAIAGYNRMGSFDKNILTVIVISKASTEKRLFVIDLKLKKVLFISYVAHGRNSGEKYATSFSNQEGSFKSSLGFYQTENTYYGKNGFSLVLNGVERGINEKAIDRGFVVHGAAYADPSTIRSCGRLGRSLGCPALPLAVSKKIIDTIKGGTLLYIHGDDKTYASRSTFIRQDEMQENREGI